MAYNLNSLALKETTSLQLRHPATDALLFDDAGNAVTVEVYGTSSKAYRNAVTAMQNRSLKRGKKQASAEQMREESIELLVACSERIDNLEYNDAPVDNAAAFRQLYSDPAFSWLKDQVDAVIGDASAFLEA